MHERQIKGVDMERGREGGRRREKRKEEAEMRLLMQTLKPV